MKLHPSPFEQMTALTDLLLGLLAIFVVSQLWKYHGFKPQLWICSFGLLAGASLLGVVAHGFEMSAQVNQLIWRPLNLCLGLALSMFVVGALYDLGGEEVAHRALPLMIAVSLLFFLVTIFVPGNFIVFIIYEAIAMLFALGVYLLLIYQGASPGAGWIAAGIVTTILAAALEASGKAGISMLWYFDNNGMFHLVQMAGILLLMKGLVLSL